MLSTGKPGARDLPGICALLFIVCYNFLIFGGNIFEEIIAASENFVSLFLETPNFKNFKTMHLSASIKNVVYWDTWCPGFVRFCLLCVITS